MTSSNSIFEVLFNMFSMFCCDKIRLSQSPLHIRYIWSSTPGVKDFSLLQRAKFTGGFFLQGRDSCLIVYCPMRNENV